MERIKTCNNGHCKEIIDIRLFGVIIEHLVKAEYDIFIPLILTQVFCKNQGKGLTGISREL
jgi:hypothetical protein